MNSKRIKAILPVLSILFAALLFLVMPVTLAQLQPEGEVAVSNGMIVFSAYYESEHTTCMMNPDGTESPASFGNRA
ncbi:MAG: hypothetical protein H6672_22265 [Anaerolineaceae bacterium]|nr:hypothetical protein [Anaerolineaceae bacterium]